MKVHKVPCLCSPCVLENGECENSLYADPWKEVDLKPVKGENKNKHRKRKYPKDCLSVQEKNQDQENDGKIAVTVVNQEVQEDDTSDDDLPDVVIDDIDEEDKEVIDLTTKKTEKGNNIFIDLTDAVEISDLNVEPIEDSDLIITSQEFSTNINAQCSANLRGISQTEDIPSQVYWDSILGALEHCINTTDLVKLANELLHDLRPLRERKTNIHFRPEIHHIDVNATESLPLDAPKNVYPIWTLPDGDCLCRALSVAYCGDESMNVEMHARVIIEGIVHKDEYCNHNVDLLQRGATYEREDEETLPTVYVKYSDNYVNGQRITESTIDLLYCKEMHDCSKRHSYMGLWQIAQASSVLNIPIRSVYPTGCDSIMRHDFNRTFFPINYNYETNDDEHIIIMWTSMQRGCTPNHFVPLLTKNIKYG